MSERSERIMGIVCSCRVPALAERAVDMARNEEPA